jgi:signal transduction histidine kinase
MTGRSLRLRIVAAAALAIFGSVAVLGVATTLLVGHQLRSSLDDSLHTRALDVARLAVSAPALLTAPGALDASSGGRQLAVEVVDRHDRIVARSAALGGRLLPAGSLLDAALRRGASGYRTATLSGEQIRLYVIPVADAGGPVAGGAVMVSAASSEIDQTLSNTRGLIALSALAAAALGAAAAALMVGRGLAPLRRLADGARAIASTGDASQRLPTPTSSDEVGDLAGSLNTMLAALERSQHTERRFLADASHELRTPLTSLRGNLSYVVRQGADPEALADLEADAARLGRLLDHLLALEREGAGGEPAETVALDQIARAAAERHGATVEHMDPSPVRGESGALERVVENMLANARMHGPAQGEVTLSLRSDGRHARLSVSDEGPGPPASERDHIFERFWRGAQAGSRPGSGLGLALVKAIAERHGGSVTVQGSCFTVELPIVREVSSSGTTLDAIREGDQNP